MQPVVVRAGAGLEAFRSWSVSSQGADGALLPWLDDCTPPSPEGLAMRASDGSLPPACEPLLTASTKQPDKNKEGKPREKRTPQTEETDRPQARHNDIPRSSRDFCLFSLVHFKPSHSTSSRLIQQPRGSLLSHPPSLSTPHTPLSPAIHPDPLPVYLGLAISLSRPISLSLSVCLQMPIWVAPWSCACRRARSPWLAY